MVGQIFWEQLFWRCYITFIHFPLLLLRSFSLSKAYWRKISLKAGFSVTMSQSIKLYCSVGLRRYKEIPKTLWRECSQACTPSGLAKGIPCSKRRDVTYWFQCHEFLWAAWRSRLSLTRHNVTTATNKAEGKLALQPRGAIKNPPRQNQESPAPTSHCLMDP